MPVEDGRERVCVPPCYNFPCTTSTTGFAAAVGRAVVARFGQPAASIPLMRTAMRLYPRSGYLYFVVLGRAYFFLGDLEQARINFEEASTRNPEYLEAHVYMAALSSLGGDKSSGMWEAEQIRALDPAFSAGRWLDSYPMTDSGQKAKLLQALSPLGLE